MIQAIKFTALVPVPVRGQTVTEAWYCPLEFKEIEVIEPNQFAFARAELWGSMIGVKLYFLKDGATHWHFIRSGTEISLYEAEDICPGLA